MTILDTTPVALDLKAMTDDELLDLYRSDGTAAAMALTEVKRRDQADQMAKARRTLAEIRAEGERQAYAQYRAADEWCRGELLSKAGKAAGITDEQALWRMPWDDAQRFASEELGLYWLHVAPRVTAAGYVRQQAAERRAAQAEARDEREATTDERIHRDQRFGRSPELAGHEAGALRRDETPQGAPQAGPGGAVDGSRPVPAGSGGSGDGQRDGRPGGSVQRDGLGAGGT